MNKVFSNSFIVLLTIFFTCCRGDTNGSPLSEMALNDTTTFTGQLNKALFYLESKCGKNGIKEVVVLRNDTIVYSGVDAGKMHNVWSCTKSFTSTVLGLLIAEGKCSLDTKVCDFVPELEEHYPDVTFRHFATMTSGYRAMGDEPQGDYVHGPSSTPFLPSSEPLFPPGGQFRYWDSAVNMFAYALTKVAGEPIKNYFKRKVADRIGLKPGEWDWKNFGEVGGLVVNGGAGNHGKGVYISAAAMARFGQLFLQQGKWDGQQILPEGWAERISTPQVKLIVPGDDTPYGFNWWTAGNWPDAPAGTFAALGHNNNVCLVFPAWNMVVVRLGLDGNIGDEKWNTFIRIAKEALK